ncbi:prepilin peptidase [Streptomyces sp. NPDC004539]|uniref:prepilin peptidase n=1 Tax=Streptomyces sp. NPDC004539 TaxID=3154280 RepID=UPI0033A28046
MTTELWASAAGAAAWGALTGALLPRAVYRFSVPLEDDAGDDPEGWRRECPEGHPLGGWLGPARCEPCGTGNIPYGHPRTPYAVLTALLATALALTTGPHPELVVWLLLLPAWVVLAAVDVQVRRLPDPLTLGLGATAPLLLGAAALIPGHTGDWTTALLGAAALGAALLALHLLNPEGMGYGDAKLAVGLGAVLGWYGWDTLLFGAFAGFALGAVYGGVLAVVRRSRSTTIAFGPFLIAGAVLGVLAGAWTA